MARVFISYKREDEAFSLKLREKLREWGYKTWRDNDRIPLDSSSWADDIQQGLESSPVVIGVATTLAMGSENVKAEWDWAIMNKRRLILLWIEECKWHHQYIRRQRIDFRSGHDTGFKKLHEALKHASTDTAPEDRYSDYLTDFYNRINRILRGTLLYTLAEKHEPKPLDLVMDTVPGQVIEAKRVEIDTFALRVGLAEEPQTTFDSFEKAFTQFDGRVLLLGNPGAGKTTTLLHYAQTAALRRRDDPSQPVPIMANIALWDSVNRPPLAEWLQNSYGAPSDVAGLLKRGEALLLLDGLDELGDERPIDPSKPDRDTYDPRQRFVNMINAQVQEWTNGNHVLVTCRVEDYTQIRDKVDLHYALQLQPLSDAQLQTVLANHPQLLVAIGKDKELADLFKTPMMMALFAFALDEIPKETLDKITDDAMVPGDVRDELVKAFISKRYNHENRRGITLPFSENEIVDALGELAMWNANDERSSKQQYDDDTNPEDNVLLPYDFRYVMESLHITTFQHLAKRLNLIEQVSEGHYRFAHLLFRDYFAFTFALRHLRDEYWYRQDYFRANPAIALGNLGDERALWPLIDLYLDQTKSIYTAEAKAAIHRLFEQFSDEQTNRLAINMLQDGRLRVSNLAVEILKGIGEPAVDQLKLLLDDPNTNINVRKMAAEILLSIDEQLVEAEQAPPTTSDLYDEEDDFPIDDFDKYDDDNEPERLSKSNLVPLQIRD